jgi:hypothetical protein
MPVTSPLLPPPYPPFALVVPLPFHICFVLLWSYVHFGKNLWKPFLKTFVLIRQDRWGTVRCPKPLVPVQNTLLPQSFPNDRKRHGTRRNNIKMAFLPPPPPPRRPLYIDCPLQYLTKFLLSKCRCQVPGVHKCKASITSPKLLDMILVNCSVGLKMWWCSSICIWLQFVTWLKAHNVLKKVCLGMNFDISSLQKALLQFLIVKSLF